MKKLHLSILSLIFTTAISSQSITSLNPNSGTQGTTALSIQISGSNTNFNSGTSTYVYFYQGSSTIVMTGYNSSVNNATSINTLLDIPFSVSPGVYGTLLYNGSNVFDLPSSFTVLPGQQPQITIVDTDYAISGTTLDVAISGLNTHFQSGSNTVWFSQGSNTIIPNSVNITNDLQLSANFTLLQQYPLGYYNVNVYDNLDNLVTKINGFYISDTTTGITITNTGKIKVYPNPVSGKMYIESTGQNIADISLTSLNGQVVLKKAGTSKEEILNTESLESGVYILSVTDQSGATSFKKVVIE